MDLPLVNGQLKGEYGVRDANMQNYVDKAKEMISHLSHLMLRYN